MAGYTLQGKKDNGDMVDIPLVITYDSAGNSITDTYVTKTEYQSTVDNIETIYQKINKIYPLLFT